MANPRTTLTSRQTAAKVNRKEKTLESWRRLRRGPPFVRINNRVLYYEDDLYRWLDEHRHEPERDQ